MHPTQSGDLAPQDLFSTAVVPVARPLTSLRPAPVSPVPFAGCWDGGPPELSYPAPIGPPPRDGFCVASAICGLTALVPVVSQLAGLALGLLGLSRLRSARLRGAPRRGAALALVGILSSAAMLLCWLGLFAAFSSVGSVLNDAALKLPLGGASP